MSITAKTVGQFVSSLTSGFVCVDSYNGSGAGGVFVTWHAVLTYDEATDFDKLPAAVVEWFKASPNFHLLPI